VKVLDALRTTFNPSVNVSPNFISGRDTRPGHESDFSFIEAPRRRVRLYLTNQNLASVYGIRWWMATPINYTGKHRWEPDLTIRGIRIAIQNQTSVRWSITLIAGGDLILTGRLETFFDPIMNPDNYGKSLFLQTQVIVDCVRWRQRTGQI